MAVKIPVVVDYKGDDLRKLKDDTRRISTERQKADRTEKEILRATREQIRNHRTVLRLSKQLNRELEKEAKTRERSARSGRGGGLAAGVRGGIMQAGAVAGVAVGINEVIQLRQQSIELAQTQARVEAQLQAAIASTGNAAGFTADQYKQMASDLQSVTNIGDESVIAAQAQLLTFNQIGNETFPRATKAVLDYATAMNSGATPSMEELRGFATQVGKALQDPEKGLTALSRTGVSFTQQQEDLIKSLVETNRVSEAQAIILGELEKQYGGSAEAARAADGGAQALSNSWGDLLEQAGRLTMATQTSNNALAQGIDIITGALGPLNDYLDVSEEVASMQLKQAGAGAETVGGLLQYIPLVGTVVNETLRWTASEEELAQARANLTEETEALGNALNANNEAANTAAELADKIAESQDKAAERAEKFADTQRDFAIDLIEIEQQLGEDIQAEQDRWLEQHQQNVEENLENEAEIWDDYKDTIEDINKDLAKSTAKIQKDSAKQLAKVDKDLTKDIAKAQKKAAQDEQNERKKARVDAAADQRLFNLQLKELAAEGDAAAIQQALERRAVEEQIEQEKAAVEQEIEGQKEADKIQELKDAAAERKMEIEAERAERIAELEAQAEEERQLAEEKRAEEMEAERQASFERVLLNKETREQTLAELEQGKQESVEKLAEQFTLMQDLTKTELSSLATIAGKAGEDVGTAFVDGMKKGAEKEGSISELLSVNAGLSQAFSGPSSFGSSPDAFHTGGTFTVGGSGGPDSQMVSFNASPGEQVTISPNITNNINGAGLDKLVGMLNRKIKTALDDGFQEYTDDVLGPALL